MEPRLLGLMLLHCLLFSVLMGGARAMSAHVDDEVLVPTARQTTFAPGPQAGAAFFTQPWRKEMSATVTAADVEAAIAEANAARPLLLRGSGTDAFVDEAGRSCIYAECPFGVYNVAQPFFEPSHESQANPRLDMYDNYKNEPNTGDKEAARCWDGIGCMARRIKPLVCPNDQARCICVPGMTAQARASWKPASNHCSGPSFTGMNDNPATVKCCDGHDYCYGTAFTTMAECDMAWGNCLMATAGYTKFQAFGRGVLGGQTPAPAADSGIVGRVLVVRRRSRDGTDGTSGL